MLGRLSVPRRPTYLDNTRARAYCACSRCGWGCLDIFLSSIFSLLSPSLKDRPVKTEMLSQRAFKPKHPTNQSIIVLLQNSARKVIQRTPYCFHSHLY